MAKPKAKPNVVHELHEPEAPAAPELRWIVPRTGGIPYAHALVGESEFTICGGHRSNGAVYPPHHDVPRCDACTAALKRRGELAAKAVADAE